MDTSPAGLTAAAPPAAGRRRWLRAGLGLAGVLGGLALAVVLAVVLAIDDGPAMASPWAVSPADVGRVHGLIERHRPTRANTGVTRAAWLAERDLELLLAEAGRRLASDARPRVLLQAGRATLQLSLALPDNPVGRWLNLHAELRQTEALPEVTALRIGRLPVPAPVARWAIDRFIAANHLDAQRALALQLVNRVAFLPHTAVVAFTWPERSLRQPFMQTLLSSADQARVKTYVEYLAGLKQAHRSADRTMPLAQALPSVYDLVQRRLAGSGRDVGSPAEENRAALVALALSAQPGALPNLLPASAAWAPMPPVALTLRGRVDFSLHFLISALIAAEGGGPLADAVGVYKEIADSRGGSGFSFNDIAADRAGTRFGLLAQADPRRLQQRLSAGLVDGDLLPPVDDLPEFMTAAQFQARYGGVDAPAYRAMMADIEARLDRLALLGSAARP